MKKQEVLSRMDSFEKLKNLPCEVIKAEGRFTGNYELNLRVIDGTFRLSYEMDLGWSDETVVYPESWSGNSWEEVIDKATKFFDDNFGKYKLVRY